MQLPNALPDETLFSRYVRHMTILGMKEKDYLKLLLNKPRASIHPYLTIGIRRASEISENSPLKIFKEQTLGRLFSYFMPHRESDIYRSILADDGNVAFRACQLVSYKESEVLSLKFCPICVQEDIKCYGVSYWHLTHQIPGIEACHLHKTWLYHKELPKRPHIKPGLLPITYQESKVCSDLSYKFSSYTSNFLKEVIYNNKSFNQNDLLTKIRNNNYMYSDKRFKRSELTSDLFNFTKRLEHIDMNLLPYSEFDYTYLSKLLSGKVSQHPFKYLLINFWLNQVPPPPANKKYLNNKDLETSENIEKECERLLKQRKSLAEISRLTGKSRCYIKSIAMKKHIPTSKKPRVIKDKIIAIIISMAHKGFHRKVIASRFNISTGSVEQIISSVPNLVKLRRQYKFESKRRRYKVQILRALQEKPSAIKQEIKQSCYAAFHWLNTHEKTWLKSTLPTPTRPQIRYKVDWRKRDVELAVKVSTVMKSNNGTISLIRLDKEISGHGWLIRMQHKLPLTMAVFNNLKAR
ncbi:TnsD family Tn7-like transposition protein [Colwellia sp. RE-S-Sl-9]